MESIPETVKLFDADACATEFEARVLSVSPGRPAAGKTVSSGKGKGTDRGSRREHRQAPFIVEIVLDRTLFFPEEGGQTPDRGTINGYPVTDVQMDGSVIRHKVEIPPGTVSELPEGDSGKDPEQETDAPAEGKQPALPFAPGQTVRGCIDFARRFSNMQNHSGEHILSGLVHNRFGYNNVGFHLSDNTVTLDFNGPLSDEDLEWLERAANRVVWDNREIRAWYPSEQELERTEYRSKKEIDGPLRLVEIPGVDVCACCAPHVKRTGEIGLIKIVRTLRERSGIRLTILCGSRALAYVQTLQRAAEDVSHLTNLPREEIASGVTRLLEDNERLRQREAQLEAMYTQILSSSVPAEQEDVFLFTDGIGNLAQRRLVNDLCAARPGYCGVFVGTDEDGYRYILGAGTGRKGTGTLDARVLNACLHKACGARGGGKPAMVQGSVKAMEEPIRNALEKALHELEE